MPSAIAAENIHPKSSTFAPCITLHSPFHSCKKQRCKYCVRIDIESLYCKSCLEPMPLVESLSYNNRCTRCYECPCCYNVVSIMISHIKEESKYYFSCQFCFWNSFKIGMIGLNPNTLLSKEKADPLQLIVTFFMHNRVVRKANSEDANEAGRR